MHKFIIYIICGFCAALINIILRWGLSFFISYHLAIIVSFFAALTSAFFLFKFFVFKAGHSNRTQKEMMWFILFNALGLIQTLVISLGLADYFFPWYGWTWYPYDVAHIVGVGFPVLTSYIGHKYLTFRST